MTLGLTIAMAATLTACDSDDETTEDKYKDWREYNEAWMTDQSTRKNADGTPYYTTAVSPVDPEAFVLYHHIGTVNNDSLKPLFTSTTKVNYTLTLANDSVADQGTNFESVLSSSNLITGWALAQMQMHVGDSIEVLIPYNLAYGTTGSGDILPYSNLRFNIRLLDITKYELR